jgi:hypothetical protein
MRWKTGGSCTGAADGTAITGGLAVASGGTNTYNFTVDTTPTNFSFTDLSSQAISTAVTSASITLAGPNVTTYLTKTGGTLTTIQASIGGGTFTAIPASGTTMPVEPNQTIQIRGTTGASTSTGYTAILGLGGATTTWTATTTAAVATITTPSISSPANGATNLNPATNSPAGIPLVANSYVANGGAGAQTSSTWEVYKGGYPITSTSTVTAVAQNAAGAWVVVPTTSTLMTGQAWAAPYNNGTWVLFGDTGEISTSTNNGATWTARNSTVTVQLLCGIYGGGKFVGGGGGNALVGGTVVRSTDGITWASATAWGTGVGLTGIAYGNGMYVAVGQNGRVAYSTDAITWTIGISQFGTSAIICISYANGIFMIGGANGKIATSTDGITWTLQTTGITDTIYGVGYGNGQWLATTDAITNISSTNNGVTWGTPVSGPGGINTSPTYADGIWRLNASNVTYTSATGAAPWASQTIAFGVGGSISAPTFANGIWMLPFSGGQVATQTTASTTLTISGCQTDGFLAGDSVLSDPGGAASGTITSVNNTTVVVVPSSASWANGQSLKRNPASYVAVTGSPITVSSAPFTTVTVPQANLAVSSTYYARVKYATTNPTAATSSFSGWSSFATASSFVPGGAFGGGYFAGQINDGGTIYNLIVAPVTSGSLNGQNGGSSPTTTRYKTTSSADAPTATVQNEVYGGPTTDLFKASAAHPVFSTFINGATGPNSGAFNLATGGAGGGSGIGGFNDWYLPAKNELEILYYNLKPDTTANNTASGINPNAVPARASNYTASVPGQTTSALFAGGAQAFSTGTDYWSSTEISSSTNDAWRQNFGNGDQVNGVKSFYYYARAIRRVAA